MEEDMPALFRNMEMLGISISDLEKYYQKFSQNTAEK